MKNKQFYVVILILAVVLISADSAFAQRGRQNFAGSCCSNIPGLTEQQRNQISALEQQHQKEMQEMRDARRKSGSYADRDAYQSAVDQKVANHRNSVRNLLNDDQKVIFDNLQAQGVRGNNPQTTLRRGNGQKGNMRGGYCGLGRR